MNLKVLDISTVEIDKTSPYYQEVYRLTAGLQAQTLEAQAQVNIKNLHDTQELNRKNMEETMRIQREEAQRAQRLQTETQFIGAHALDQQASVLRAGAESLGQMGQMGGGGDGSGGGGMNAAGMMAGMMMAGAMGQQMAGMMTEFPVSAPETGSQPSLTAKRMIIKSPAQKLGIDSVTIAKPDRIESSQDPCFSAARMPSGRDTMINISTETTASHIVYGIRAAYSAQTFLFPLMLLPRSPCSTFPIYST